MYLRLDLTKISSNTPTAPMEEKWITNSTKANVLLLSKMAYVLRIRMSWKYRGYVNPCMEE
jgi:hypothetical protein